jgi:hypothetical protein
VHTASHAPAIERIALRTENDHAARSGWQTWDELPSDDFVFGNRALLARQRQGEQMSRAESARSDTEQWKVTARGTDSGMAEASATFPYLKNATSSAGKAGRWVNGDPAVGRFLELRAKAMLPGQVDLSMDPRDYGPVKKTMIPLRLHRDDPADQARLAKARHRTFEFGRSTPRRRIWPTIRREPTSSPTARWRSGASWAMVAGAIPSTLLLVATSSGWPAAPRLPRRAAARARPRWDRDGAPITFPMCRS